jgi:hypothetical protein
MGPYAGIDYNSPYLMVNSLVLSTPTKKGKGLSWEGLSYWLSTFVSVCQFPKPVFYVSTSTEKGEGRGES